MSNIYGEDRETQNIGSGGFGSSWCVIIVVLLVAWLLFKDGGHGHDGGHGYGGGYPGYGYGCGIPVQPTFKDESNFEEERNINAKLCCVDKDIWNVDRDVWKTACETQQVEHCEAEKTRDLIRCEVEKNLRDKLAESQMCNMTLKQEMFTEKKIDQVLAAIGCTNQRIEKLECEVPKRPPVWAESVTPDTHHTDCDHRGDRYGYDNYPRRGKCDGYGYGYDGCCA